MKEVAQKYIDFLINFEYEQIRELCHIIDAPIEKKTSKGLIPFKKKELIQSIRETIAYGVNDNKLFRFSDLAKKYFDELGLS